MFLDTVLTRNPQLADTAAALHASGAIPPNTYVLDRDAVEANATLLAAEGERLDIAQWFVVKQLGRNPELIRTIARRLPRFAAIDAQEADQLHAAGARPGNLGHLVQIPKRALPRMLSWRPEAVTVFDADNARAVSDAAREQGFVQDVLVRLAGGAGSVYPGQEGGVSLETLDSFATTVEKLPGVRIAGVTTFPCLQCDPDTGKPGPTPNLTLLLKAAEVLSGRGHTGLKVSAPGVTSMATLPLLAELGATHGEPGHALTGTTPLHAQDPWQPETPGYVYVTEVAHTLVDGRPSLHGGGFYPRAGIASALLPRTGLRLGVQQAPAENIDYYRLLDPPTAQGRVRAGDTAVLAFRTQIFVTRSTVAVVSGLSTGDPKLVGLYDSLGHPLATPERGYDR